MLVTKKEELSEGFSWGERRTTCPKAGSLMLGKDLSTKEDLPEGQFAFKDGGPAGGQAYGVKEGGPTRGQRRRTLWRASSLVLGTKKDDLPCRRASCLILETKKEFA